MTHLSPVMCSFHCESQELVERENQGELYDPCDTASYHRYIKTRNGSVSYIYVHTQTEPDEVTTIRIMNGQIIFPISISS